MELEFASAGADAQNILKSRVRKAWQLLNDIRHPLSEMEKFIIDRGLDKAGGGFATR